jgi:hypothetical protein
MKNLKYVILSLSLMVGAPVFAQNAWTSVINIEFRDYEKVLDRVSWEEGHCAPTQIVGESLYRNVPKYDYYEYSEQEDFKYLIGEAARSIEKRYGRIHPLWIYSYKLHEGYNTYTLYRWNQCWFIYVNYSNSIYPNTK